MLHAWPSALHTQLMTSSRSLDAGGPVSHLGDGLYPSSPIQAMWCLHMVDLAGLSPSITSSEDVPSLVGEASFSMLGATLWCATVFVSFRSTFGPGPGSKTFLVVDRIWHRRNAGLFVIVRHRSQLLHPGLEMVQERPGPSDHSKRWLYLCWEETIQHRIHSVRAFRLVTNTWNPAAYMMRWCLSRLHPSAPYKHSICSETAFSRPRRLSVQIRQLVTCIHSWS